MIKNEIDKQAMQVLGDYKTLYFRIHGVYPSLMEQIDFLEKGFIEYYGAVSEQHSVSFCL